MTTLKAHDGLELPAIGFGTYNLRGSAGADAIAGAIERGYTLLDSAFNYENEGCVGEGVRRSGARREDVIVTSKLPGRYQDHDMAAVTIEESLYRLGLDYIDLYLIHWPNPKVGKYIEAWGALIEAKKAGLLKHIGVCNFLPEHLTALEMETGVMPEVNQIELHPLFPQVEQVEFDKAHGIITEAWSPLVRGGVLDDPVITQIAEKHGATPGQVVLAWDIAREILPIPKAASPARQIENLGALDVALDSEDVAAITTLGRSDGRIKGQDPAVYEEF